MVRIRRRYVFVAALVGAHGGFVCGGIEGNRPAEARPPAELEGVPRAAERLPGDAEPLVHGNR